MRILPFPFVDHTHADALLTITNTRDGARRVREVYGDTVVVVPYVMPGFDLARAVAEQLPRESTPNTVGLVLLNHGFFSFGQSAREAYERMIDLVARAEAYLVAHGAWDLARPEPRSGTIERADIVGLRRQVSDAAGAPMILATHAAPKVAGICAATGHRRHFAAGASRRLTT